MIAFSENNTPKKVCVDVQFSGGGYRKKEAFFWFGGILGSASRAEFPVS